MSNKDPKPGEQAMKNPYEVDADHGRVLMGRGVCWSVVAVFLMILVLPPVYRNLVQGEDGPVSRILQKDAAHTLRKHLKVYESEDLEKNAPFAEAPRAALLTTLLDTFREGQGTTVFGEDGWMFYRPAIESLTGYGPLKPEPESVTKDPEVKPWNQPLPVIRRFQQQLASAGVELIVVPIPVKTMIYPEKLASGLGEEPITHVDAAAFYDAMRASGIRVVNLTGPMARAKENGKQLFLKQDTHWTPDGMQLAAKVVADELKSSSWIDSVDRDEERLQPHETVETFQAWGDLVARLELDEDQLKARFDKETVHVRRVLDTEEGEALSPDRDSPVVLLGDSFCNIYSLGSMEFGSSAGFPEHLALELGLPLDVIAQNGQGATGVRRTLLSRPEAHDMLESKKAVVWAIAARDFLLSETPARNADVFWGDVVLNTAPKSDELPDATIRGLVIETSTRQDPTRTPYKNAITDAIIRVESVQDLTGTGAVPEEIRVSTWAFQNRQPSPAYQWKAGFTEVTVKLTDFARASEAGWFKEAKVTGDIDIDFDNPRDHFWVVEDLGASATSAGPAASGLPPSIAATLTALVAIGIGGSCLVLARRHPNPARKA